MRSPFGAKDYYAILGVDLNSSSVEIKTAFRNKVKEYHPDKFFTFTKKAWATTKMAELNEAYEVLGNPLKRSEYNQGYKIPVNTSRWGKTKVEIYWEKSSGYVAGTLWVISLIFFLYLFKIQNFDSTHLFQSLSHVILKIFGAAFLSLFVVMVLVMPLGFFIFTPILAVQELRDYWRKQTRTPSSIISEKFKTNAQILGFFAILAGIGILSYYFLGLVKKGQEGFFEGMGLSPIIEGIFELIFVLFAFIFFIIGANLGLMGICILPFVLIETLALMVVLIWSKKVIRKTQALVVMED